MICNRAPITIAEDHTNKLPVSLPPISYNILYISREQISYDNNTSIEEIHYYFL